MTTRLFSALAAVLLASVPVPVFATAIFSDFFLEIGDDLFRPTGLTGVPCGTGITCVNIASPTGGYHVGGNTYTITPLSTGNARIFGTDSALDQISLTNSVITFTAGEPDVELRITYGFTFPLPANLQTYGLQAGGTFKPAPAAGDSVSITSAPGFNCGESGCTGPGVPLSTGEFVVDASNTFGPIPAPSGVKRQISCTGTGAPASACTGSGKSYLFETIVTLHFEHVGDSVRISNSFDGVSAPCDGEACAGADEEVQARLDELAAADAAALPEPSVIVLLLGSGLAGFGLHRLRHRHG